MIVLAGHSILPNGLWPEFVEWAANNGFDAADVTGTVIAIGNETISVRLYDRNAEGNLFRDHTGTGVSARGHLLPLVEPLTPALREFGYRFAPEPEWPCPRCGTVEPAGTVKAHAA